jgi:hypothetical protein
MNDNDLLDTLTAALTPTPVDPPAQGLRSLHDAVRAASAPRLRRRWAIPAIVGIGAISMSGVAAAGVPLPRVVRQVGHDVGLPLDSPQLLDARHHRRALQAALADGDLGTTQRAAAVLRADLARLDQDERGKIEPDAASLLEQADEQGTANQSEDPQDDAPGNPAARHTTPPAEGTNSNNPSGPGQRDQSETSTDGPATGRGTETGTDGSRSSVSQLTGDHGSTGGTDDNG